jgi:hypothetical protein
MSMKIPFTEHVPSLLGLRNQCRSQLPHAPDEVVQALATLAQAAHEEYLDWRTDTAAIGEPPPNPANYDTVAGLATIYASLR